MIRMFALYVLSIVCTLTDQLLLGAVYLSAAFVLTFLYEISERLKEK